MRIHKEGRTILSVLLFVLVAMNIILFWYINAHTVILAANMVLSILTFGFFLYFFRNPKRKADIDDNNLIIAPADGRIVAVEPTDENEYFDDRRMQVSIFMSVFNVHANWYPIAGTVLESKHHAGRHLAAWLPKSSHENERSTIVIETGNKTKILIRQIAGALARRIVTYAAPGKACHLNEHLGFIKFGSRVDLFLPLNAEIFVEVGEKTTGNETVIARLKD